MKFDVESYTAGGQRVRERIEAQTESEARAEVTAKGLYVTEVTAVGGRSKANPGGGLKDWVAGLGGGNLKQVADFTRQLSVLVGTSTPVVQSLQALERQARNENWRATVADLRERVEEGAGLAEAMAHHPRDFDAVYRSLIAAGESGGNMSELLGRLTRLTRQQLATRTALIGAMVYPLLLLSITLSVMIVLIIKVLPRFEELFETLNTPLPASTAILLDISHLLRDQWWVVLLAVAGVVGLFVTWARTEGGKTLIDLFVIRVPKFGGMTRDFIVARIIRVLGVLIDAKVPLIDAIEIARDSTTNVHYAGVMEQAIEGVTRGEPLNTSLASGNLFSDSLCEALRNGENTGRVADVLLTLADIMDEDNAVVIRSISSIIEPLILSVMGVLVGSVAMSLFLPLFDLAASTGG